MVLEIDVVLSHVLLKNTSHDIHVAIAGREHERREAKLIGVMQDVGIMTQQHLHVEGLSKNARDMQRRLELQQRDDRYI